MKILIIEDDADFIQALTGILTAASAQIQIEISESLDCATTKIKESIYDLMILDLNIPTIKDALDGDPTHGHSAFTVARHEAPGTPVIVLTGSSAEDFIESMLSMGDRNDIWGGGSEMQLVTLHKKHKLDTFPNILANYTSSIEALRQIELHRNGTTLSDAEERLIRIFSRTVGGVYCSVSKISGGLSDSRVFRLIVNNSSGEKIHDTVCKIGNKETVKDEDLRYGRYVARLPPEATPRKLALLEHGAKKDAGIFYSLANGFENNFFSHNALSNFASHTVSSLEDLLKNWSTDIQTRKKIIDIRRLVLSDEIAKHLIDKFSLNWATTFEENYVQVKWGCAHGDLHGLNILTANDGSPILIDYGDTGDAPSSLDPITLELSVFFHPDGPLKTSEWPTLEQAKRWLDLSYYLTNCPYPEFISACRAWATNLSVGQREISAVAYSYLLRQLKYDGPRSDLAVTMLNGIKEHYDTN